MTVPARVCTQDLGRCLPATMPADGRAVASVPRSVVMRDCMRRDCLRLGLRRPTNSRSRRLLIIGNLTASGLRSDALPHAECHTECRFAVAARAVTASDRRGRVVLVWTRSTSRTARRKRRTGSTAVAGRLDLSPPGEAHSPPRGPVVANNPKAPTDFRAHGRHWHGSLQPHGKASSPADARLSHRHAPAAPARRQAGWRPSGDAGTQAMGRSRATGIWRGLPMAWLQRDEEPRRRPSH